VSRADRSDSGIDLVGISRDERLRSARRIDWRFLLSDPRLHRFSLGGRPDDELRAALDRAILDERGRGGGVRSIGDHAVDAETVVVSGPFDPAELAAASTAAGPHDRLVVEIDRSFLRGPDRRSIRAAAGRITRTLRDDGWATRIWWAWPQRTGATAWVATDDQVAIRALMSRRFPSLPLQIASGLAASGLGRRVIEAVAPSLTVIAQRAPDVATRPRPFSGPEREASETGLLLLTPRFRASAHVVALHIDGATGHVAEVVKIARLPDDGGPAREGAILARLAAAAPTKGRWPAPTGPTGATAFDGGWPSVGESALIGRPLAPNMVRADPRGAAVHIEGLLEEMPVGPAASRAMPVRERLSSAVATIRAIAEGPGGDLRTLADRAAAVLAGLDAAELPVVFEHGDPAHPNLILLEDGRLGAVDWERGEPDGLPLHDLTIALAYVAAAERGATEARAQASAFADAVQDPHGWAAPAFAGAADRLDVDRRLVPPLMVAAWTRSVAWLVTALGPSDSDPTAIRWLMTNRAVALWQTSLAMAEAS
jgi:hypothetical protein